MRKAKTAKIVILLTLVTSFTVALYFHSLGRDKRTVYRHRNDHHPVINELFAGKIDQDQPVGELLSSCPPSKSSTHHNFMTLSYVKNIGESDPCCGGYSSYIQIIAMNEKLVKAFAVEGVLSEIEYVFFDEMDQDAEDDYWASRLQYITENR
jgi:hypothetical protein